jgi:TolB-like protein
VLIAGVVVGLVHFRKSPAAATGKVMLVVLPFRNFSGDPAQDFLADGMTEELITQVGSLNPERLGVIARTSAMQYQNTQKDTAAIARELGVNYLIEGSIRRAGNRIRVTAQLIQTSDQTHIWAESFDRNVSDVLQIQSEIASAVANKVQIALSQQTRQRLLAERHVQPEAYEAYLEGLQAWNQRSRESEEKAVAAFQRAIAIDPQYALAYGALARAYALAPVFALQPPAEMMPKARDAALHAVAIDDSLAEAHTVLGFVKAHYDFDWPGAEREFVRALELNSSCATAYLFYSNAYLSPHGQHEAAIAELQKGIQLNPLSTPMVSYLGRTYIWARRYDEALAQLQKAEKMDPNFAVTHERMARVYAYMGNYQQAIDEDEKARLLSGEDAEQVIRKRNRIRRALAERGARGYWETLLEFSRDRDNPSEAYVTPFGIAIIQARLGNKDRAIEFLEQAYEQRDTYLTSVAVEPAFDNLRDEPRFAELLQKVGLSQ